MAAPDARYAVVAAAFVQRVRGTEAPKLVSRR
jgi:hypothetical protein